MDRSSEAQGEGSIEEPLPSSPAGASVGDDEGTRKVGPPAPLVAPTAQRQYLPPGSRLGRYVIVGKLGEGGMGVIYAAYDSELHRKVAIKLLHTRPEEPSRGSSGSGSGAQERLLREAQALAQLSHPNVVSVHDVGTHEDAVFMAMAFVEGLNVRQWLKAKPRSWREVLDVFRQAGQGLAAAHDSGLVHRDFKPDNVLLSQDGRVFVLDFGLARAGEAPRPSGRAPVDHGIDRDVETAATPLVPASEVASSRSDHSFTPAASVAPASTTSASASASVGGLLASPLTQAGVVVGTASYMAPELFAGTPASVRTDVFAFAVALYEGLHGQRPFATSGPDRWKVRPPAPDRNVPLWLSRIVLKGLAIAPDDRPASMHAFLAELAKDPAPKRRQRLIAVGVLGAVALIGVGAQRAVHTRSELCKGESARLAGVWDGEIEATLRSAFLATGKPHAQTTADRVIPALGRYAESLVAARTDACVQTRINGTQTEEALGLKMECLDRRRTELAALTDVLAHPASASVVDRAIDAVNRLTPLRVCEDLQALRAPVRPPEDPAVRTQVEAVRRDIAHGRALLDSAQYPRALEVAAALVPAAEKLGYAPLEAESFELLARVQNDLGQLAEARTAYQRSALAALAGRDLQTCARASTALVWNAYFQGDKAQVPFWTDHARAALAAAGGNATTESELHMALAGLADERGEYDKAVELSRRALVLARKGGVEAQVAWANNNLGIGLNGLHRYEEAAGHLEQALEINGRIFGADHPHVANHLHELGSILLTWKGPTPDAERHLTRSLELRRERLGDRHYRVGESLNGLALLYAERGAFQRALEFVTLLEQVDEPDPGVQAKHLQTSGAILRGAGRPEQALELHRRAAQLIEKNASEDHPGRALAQHHLALSLAAVGQRKEAAASLDQALEGWTRAGKTDSLEFAEALGVRGEWRLQAGDWNSALPDLERALDLTRTTLGDDHRITAARRAVVGEAQLLARRAADARQTLERALSVLENEPVRPDMRARARFALARALEFEDAAPERAQTLATRALEEAERSEHSDRTVLVGAIRTWLSRR